MAGQINVACSGRILFLKPDDLSKIKIDNPYNDHKQCFVKFSGDYVWDRKNELFLITQGIWEWLESLLDREVDGTR